MTRPPRNPLTIVPDRETSGPIIAATLALRRARSTSNYTFTRLMLLTLAASLESPDDARRCLLLLITFARMQRHQLDEADAWWLLACLEQREGLTLQAAGDLLRAAALFSEAPEHAERCMNHLHALREQFCLARAS